MYFGQKSVIQYRKCMMISFNRSFLVHFSSELLYENESFKYRQLAGLVCSKVYYHLGSLDNALTYALGAGHLFDVNDKTEYVDTIIGQSRIFIFTTEYIFPSF
jgi:hypothetical protein